MRVRETVENPDSQFVAMPSTITPAGIELNPTTEPIEEPKKLKNSTNNKSLSILACYITRRPSPLKIITT